MRRKLLFTEEASSQLDSLRVNPAKQGIYQQACKTLGLLETNPRHPSLKTHEYSSIRGFHGEKIFEAYVQQKTPGAYRLFFHYGPDEYHGRERIATMTIVAIIPHP